MQVLAIYSCLIKRHKLTFYSWRSIFHLAVFGWEASEELYPCFMQAIGVNILFSAFSYILILTSCRLSKEETKRLMVIFFVCSPNTLHSITHCHFIRCQLSFELKRHHNAEHLGNSKAKVILELISVKSTTFIMTPSHFLPVE